MSPDFGLLTSILYAVAFLVAAYLGLFFIKKYEMDLDRRFYLWSSSMTVLSGILVAELSIVLNSYIKAFLSTSIILFLLLTLSELIKRIFGIERYFSIPVISVIMSAPLLGKLSFDISYLVILGLSITFWSIPLVLASAFDNRIYNKEILLPIIGQFLDASSTYTNLRFGGEENVFLPFLFVENLGDWSIFLLKALVVLPGVIFIYRSEIETTEKKYFLFLIYALGLGLASHNVFIGLL